MPLGILSNYKSKDFVAMAYNKSSGKVLPELLLEMRNDFN